MVRFARISLPLLLGIFVGNLVAEPDARAMASERCTTVKTCDDLISRCSGPRDDWDCATYDNNGACSAGSCIFG